MQRTVSPAGLRFIQGWEALRLYAYPDPASDLARATQSLRERWGHVPASTLLATLPESIQGLSGAPWTVGYGSTHGVNRGTSITEAMAEDLLRRDLAPVEVAINALGLPLTQNQFDALASIGFNLGVYSLVKGHALFDPSRSLGQALRGIGELSVPEAIKLYDHAGGYRVEGLTRRRAAEATLWATPDSVDNRPILHKEGG